MAIAPDRLRYVLWGTLLTVLYWGTSAWERIRQGDYWDAAAFAALGGLLVIAYTRPRDGRVRTRDAALCAALILLGGAAWMVGPGTPVRLIGFTVMAGTLVAVMTLPRTAPPPHASGMDEPPIQLGLSEGGARRD
jgi:hypothetical protein